jgi:predicted TPR repeat methyltransferase
MSESPAFERARQHFLDGLGHLEAGRLAAAERSFLDSLAHLPGRVSTLVNLAAVRLRLSRPAEALQAADEVLAQAPDERDGWLHRSTALAQLGRTQEALAAYDRLLQIDPGLAQAWVDRGSLLREMHRLDEAARCFERAIALGADNELTRYYLASVSPTPVPPTAPRAYVETLFDTYADDFDQHLVDTLGYQAHRVLAEPLPRLLKGVVPRAIDLGCGTGLCGALLRPLTRNLTGVDLSAAMLDKAAALGVYDQLVQADLVDHLLQHERAGAAPLDLVVATDVFIYVGALESVFAAVRPVLAPAGLFCFSVELAPHGPADGPRDVVLQPSLRYAHGLPYLLRLARAHGLTVVHQVRQPVRRDQHEAIDGLFVYLTAS